jgi:hypothetical protein
VRRTLVMNFTTGGANGYYGDDTIHATQPDSTSRKVHQEDERSVRRESTLRGEPAFLRSWFRPATYLWSATDIEFKDASFVRCIVRSPDPTLVAIKQ